jgi:hypothetical protein
MISSSSNLISGRTTKGSSSIRIVNTIDPNLVHDYLASSAGERVIINHIQRNAGKIKQVVVAFAKRLARILDVRMFGTVWRGRLGNGPSGRV